MHEGAWHHVLRQLLLYPTSQLRPSNLDSLRHKIRYELFLPPGIFPGYDYRLAHSGVFVQYRLDLSEFDTEATNFHLVVDPVEEFDIPGRQVTG